MFTSPLQPTPAFLKGPPSVGTSPYFGAKKPQQKRTTKQTQPKNTKKIEKTKPPKGKTSQPQQQPSPEAQNTGYLRSAWAYFQSLIASFCYYLWPLNWPIFTTQSQNTPSKENTVTQPAQTATASKASRSSASKKSRSTSQKAPKSAASAEPINEAATEQKPKRFEKWLGYAMRGMLNAFHIGAALFVLAGASFIQAPLWMGITSVVGVQILQSWVNKKYPGAHVLNPDQMKIVARRIIQKYDLAMTTGRAVLRKIPLLNRLDPVYKFTAMRIRKVFQKGINFLAQKLIPTTVSMSKIPDEFWDKSFGRKLWFLAYTVLMSSVSSLCKPLGKAGQWIVQILNAKDATAWVNSFAPRKPKTAESQPTQKNEKESKRSKKPKPQFA